MFTARDTIMAALFAQLQTAAGFNYFGRRVLLFNQCPNHPALFLRKIGETYPPRRALGLPAIATIEAEIIIQWKTDSPDPATIPESTGNALIDAVEAVLQPLPGQQAVTLGGLVNHVWIEGRIDEHHGDQLGQGMAILQVKITVPC